MMAVSTDAKGSHGYLYPRSICIPNIIGDTVALGTSVADPPESSRRLAFQWLADCEPTAKGGNRALLTDPINTLDVS